LNFLETLLNKTANNMTHTSTFSSTDTYTDSRAKYVMDKVSDDFHHLIARGFKYPGKQEIQNWRDDLLFLMKHKALIKFQIKFEFPSGGKEAWEYILKSDNSIQVDNKSGGKDLYDYHTDTSVSIVISRDHSKAEVNEYLEKRGWVSGRTLKK
jgi:Bacterial HORMA domain family 1